MEICFWGNGEVEAIIHFQKLSIQIELEIDWPAAHAVFKSPEVS